ncbi:MAG: multicopper oxidase family protein [Pseudomonadota bacterium]
MVRNFTRRQALRALGVGAVAASWPLSSVLASGEVLDLSVQSTRFPLLGVDGPLTEGIVSTRPDGPPPVIRFGQGQAFRARVNNALSDYTAMHWHGLRVPNGMDGVPYLTQFPIGPNEAFEYAFTSPDAGTYWYHPHCMTMDQMALGLTGILIVEEDEEQGFDAEIPLNLRDFRLNGDGEWIELWTLRGAARGGSFGTVMTTNWLQEPVYDAPAGGLVRVRIAATDPTRIYKVYVPGGKGAVIALDGHPLAAPAPLPLVEEDALFLGPGQRVDFALLMPMTEGEEVKILADVPGPEPRILAGIRALGANAGRAMGEIKPLPANPIPEPDLSAARVEDFVFGWSPEGGAPDNGFCGSLGANFWSINRNPWPGDAAPGTGPLATFDLGESVVLRLHNESPNAHPIHLHGQVFRPVQSNQRPIAPHWTDTVLLNKDERIDIAFVADNPGDWAFHCHVIEHQKTGLAGFIRVRAG